MLTNFIIVTAVHAQEHSFYLGFYGGYALENLDKGTLDDKFTNSPELSFGDALAFQIRGGMAVKNYLFVEALLEYAGTFEDEAGEKNMETEVINAAANFKAVWISSGKFQPYVSAGLGLMNSREEIQCRDQICKNEEWGLSIRAGAGVDIFVSPSVAVGAESAYVLGLGDTDYIRYTLISMGVRYYF
jgi:opacity protein-like surface antigen